MLPKHKLYIKLAVVGIIVFYTLKKYKGVANKLKSIPVAGKLFK